MITRKKLINQYIEFFKTKGHKEIPNSPLIPENDPTVLFTTAGMHPLVPYLLGQSHPLGKRLVNVQKCIRTGDIDKVGDEHHHTFFEMLGNWSLGDYFKKQAIEYSVEFLTKVLKISKEKISITCFAGDKDAPKDTESAEVWKKLGIKKIKFLPKKDNWWGPAGNTGPCGPDTEMFIGEVEIWNNVFMEYNKDKRIILVDGMHCIYDENFKLNEELLKIINHFNTHTLLVVNGFREKGLNLIKNNSTRQDTNWKAFSLEESKIKKDNPKYFKILLKKFNLVPEEVIYFDHDKKNVETAKKLGILSQHYTNITQIKEFIEKNLLAFIPLKQKNVDTGMGVERVVAILTGINDDYLTDSYKPIIEKIEKLSGKKYNKDKGQIRAMRIIADHIKASVFILAEGIEPSNTEHGYVLRRLIRRAVRYGKEIGMKNFATELVSPILKIYQEDYPELKKNEEFIREELAKEEERFEKCIQEGLKVAEKIFAKKTPILRKKFVHLMQLAEKTEILHQTFNKRREGKNYSIKEANITQKEIDNAIINGKESFLLYQSYGFPIEMITEIAREKNLIVPQNEFRKECLTHQQLSRTATQGKFKSGLADQSQATTRLHTATHLLLAALRIVLKKPDIIQRGSNITAERARFDFSFPRQLTKQELKEVEDLVNAQIQNSCEVKRKEMPLEQAKKKGIIATFSEKYGEKVSVYEIGDFSREVCAGPHVENLCKLGKFKIIKEESSSSGVRRIKAELLDFDKSKE